MNEALVVSTVLLWIVVFFNLLLTLALIRRQRQQPGFLRSMSRFEMLPAGTKAPDFTAETLDGGRVRLADFKGKKTAFVFVTPHCQPCKDRLPALEAFHQSRHEDDPSLVLVVDAELKAAQDFADEHKLTIPTISAPRGTNALLLDYQATSTPSFTLIDAGGTVLSSGLLTGNFPSLLRGEQSMRQRPPMRYSVETKA